MTASPADHFRSALTGAIDPENPTADEAQVRAMFAYYEEVVEANRHFNLTRIVDPTESAVKHFADSLSVLGWVNTHSVRVSSVLDVGTGAGFPAVPLAVMRPDWQVTAIDSTAKKVRFVAASTARLNLTNLSTAHRRAGEWQPPHPFDLVTCKAVGKLNKCLEQSPGLAKRGGYVIVYKTGAVPNEERQAALETARRLRLEVLDPYRYRLRLDNEIIERTLWIFRK